VKVQSFSRVSNLVGTCRRQYGEDLESFSTGKTKTNWLSINNETHRLRAAVRDQVVKLLAPAVFRYLDLPSNHPWTRQVSTCALMCNKPYANQSIFSLDTRKLLVSIQLPLIVGCYSDLHHGCRIRSWRVKRSVRRH
jgi:hypothetical protein